MAFKLLIIASLFIFFATIPIFADLKINSQINSLELSGQNGGLVSNEKPWTTDSLSKKTTVLFYIDPDFAELNDHVSKALTDAKFPPKTLHSVAIINNAATWIPNFAIRSRLEEKQKEFPNTVYALDLNKILVNRWGLTDDSYVVLAINKVGNLMFNVSGKLTDQQVKQLITLLKKDIAK